MAVEGRGEAGRRDLGVVDAQVGEALESVGPEPLADDGNRAGFGGRAREAVPVRNLARAGDEDEAGPYPATVLGHADDLDVGEFRGAAEGAPDELP